MPVYSYDDTAEAYEILSDKGVDTTSTKDWDADDHTPKTDRGKAADKRLRRDQAAKDKAQQQKALDKAAADATTKATPDKKGAEAAAIRSTVLLPFRNSDGSYNLQKVIRSRAIGAGTLRSAGFTDRQITAAINQAMAAAAPTQEDLLGLDEAQEAYANWFGGHTPTTEQGKAAEAAHRASQAASDKARQEAALGTGALERKLATDRKKDSSLVGAWFVYREGTSRARILAKDRAQALRIAKIKGWDVTKVELAEIRDMPQDKMAEALTGAARGDSQRSQAMVKEYLIMGNEIAEGDKLMRDVDDKGDVTFYYIPKSTVDAQRVMEKYLTPDGGYRIHQALYDGVPVETIVAAGFNYEQDIKPVQLWLKRNRELIKKLQPYYKEADAVPDPDDPHGYVSGYDIDTALEKGAIQPSELVELGFDRAVVSGAMDRVSLKSWPAFRQHEQFKSVLAPMWGSTYPEFYKMMKERGLDMTVDRLLELHKELRSPERIRSDVLGEDVELPQADALKKLIADAKAQGINTPTERELWKAFHDVGGEYKSWLMGLPSDHPEKIAMRHRIENVGMLALTALTPATYPAAATAGQAALVGNTPRVPTASKVARAIAGLVQGAVTVAPEAHVLAQQVGGYTNLANIEQSLSAFEGLPQAEQSYWMEKAAVPVKSWEHLNDDDKAKTVATYNVPAGVTIEEWSHRLQQATDTMTTKVAEWSDYLKEATNPSVSVPGRVIINGVAGVAEQMAYMGQIPLIAAMLADQTAKGNAKDYAAMVALGMASFFTEDLKGHFQKDPASASGRVVGLFLLSPGALVKYAKGIGVKLDPRYVAKRAVGSEFTTIRIHPPKGNVRIKPEQLKALTDKLVRELVTTKEKVARASIKTKAGEWVAEIRSTPYQRVIKGSVFHFTNDISAFLKDGVKVGETRLFASPQAAVRFAVMNSRGKEMKQPGLVEIHLTGKDLKKGKLNKLLSKGEAELEMSLPAGTQLHSVPGIGGRGVSFDLRTGAFPIVRFTTSGAKGWKGPTLAELGKIRMEAAKAAAGDFFLGWYGRQLALREILFKKDPKVERIKKSIDEMKAQQPETVDSKTGEITRQRNPVPHPDGKGTMQSRVTGVVHHPDAKGTIMLVMDKSESAYGLPGGQIAKRYYPGALGFTKGADGRMYLTFEGAMHGQIKSETGVGIKNTQYVDVYRGKVNEHALSGSRVYEATADGVKLDPVEATRRHGKKGELPELKDALWWDGKTDITVYPATRDILLAFAKEYGWDMSKVHVYKGASSFLKRSRDRQFFYRRRMGEQLTEKQIEAVNAREIKSLNGEWNQHLKGEPASLRHFLEGEYDLTDILQLIEGRRRVLKTFEQTGRLDLMQEAAIKRSGLWEKYENALKAEEKVRAEEVSRIYDEAMTKVLEGEMYQPYMDALTMARIDNYPAYVSRYLHYYREAMRNPAKPVEAIRREYETAYKDVLQNYNKVQQYVSEQRPTPKRYDAPRKGGSSGYTTGKYPPTTQYPPPTTPPPGEPPPPQEPPVYPPYDLKVPPPPDTPKRPPRKSPALLTKKDRQRYAVGDVGWKQGRFWIKARPPWGDKPRKVATSGDVVYSLRALPGAKVLKGTPEETFFTRGKRLPKRFVVSMGSSKVTVRPKDKPHLLFGPGSKYAKKKRKNRKKARR